MADNPDRWTGRLVGRMHNNGISNKDLAKELDCTAAYVSMVLNGARKPGGARERFEDAVSRLIEKKKSANA